MRPDSLINQRRPAGGDPGGPVGQEPDWNEDDGKLARSWRLLGRCWVLLRARPRLFVMPAVGAAATTAAALVIFLPVLWWTRGLPDKVSLLIAGAVAALPFTLIATIANVGFLAMVDAHLRGEAPRVRDGLRAAWRRRWAILGWSALDSGVGSAVNALEELPGVSWFGQLVGVVGGVGWGVATFFVVPVLVVEKVGPISGVRRSARVFRERWKATLVGDLTLGAVLSLAELPGVVLLLIGATAFRDSAFALGAVLLGAGIVLLIPLLVIESAMTKLFQYALYRDSVGEGLPAPFTPADVGAAFTRRRRWLG